MLAEVVDIAEVAEALTIQLLFQYLCRKKKAFRSDKNDEWMNEWCEWWLFDWYEYFYCWWCDNLYPFKIVDKQVTSDSIGQQAEKFAKLPW